MYNSLMSFETDSVGYKQCTGKDGYNDLTFAVPVDIDCMLVYSIKKVVDLSGTETVSSLQIYTSNLTSVHSDDIFTVEGRDYNVKAFDRFKDNGNMLWVVYM